MDVSTKMNLNTAFDKLPLKKLNIFAFIISIITVIVGLISQIILPPEIPLFYGLPQNSAQISPSILIILPSSIAILMTSVNILISMYISDNYLKKALVFTSLLIAILSAITTYKILLLVSLI